MGATYIAIIDGKITAHHDCKKVVKKYLKLYKESHPTESVILGKTTSNPGPAGDELMPIEHIYIQERFVDCYLLFCQPDTTEIDALIKRLEKLMLSEQSKKRLQVFYNGLVSLEKVQRQLRLYVPSVKELAEYERIMYEYEYARACY